MTAGINEVRDYWEWYIENTSVPGESCGSPGFFESIRRGHRRAYGPADERLDLQRLHGRSLLELGCGIGLDTVQFARHGAAVTAVDVSPRALELAGRNLEYHGLSARLEVANAETLSFPDDRFDFVVARGILMFTPDDAKLMTEIRRVLKPGGEAQLLLHNRFSWYVLLARVAATDLVHAAGGPPVNRLYTRREARALVSDFSAHEISFARFPTATKRRGPFAELYNRALVPVAQRLPQRALERLGYYLIVRAVK